MIEWVEIKDWESDGKDSYLVLIEGGMVCVVRDQYKHKPGHNWTYFYKNVTHAAKINFPAEKALEEKFEDYYANRVNGILTTDLIRDISAIAKEHYEGKG